MARSFPDGAGLDDATRIEGVADQLADAAGIGEALRDVWPSLGSGIYDGTEADQPYPYEYPSLDPLGVALTDSVVAGSRDDLFQLANLMVLAAVHAVPDVGSSLDLSRGAPVADLIFRRLAGDGSCDATLSQAWLVGLGDAPRRTTIDHLFARAVKVCPTDPTARWLWGHRLVEDSANDSFHFHDGMTRRQALSRPITFFQRWIKEEPESALAHAGMADALTREAQAMSGVRVMPFTVKDYAARADAEYRSAAALSPDPAFVLGRAVARSLVGKTGAPDEVAGLAGGANPTANVEDTYTALLERAHRFTEAAAAASVPTKLPDAFSVVFRATGYASSPWLGATDAIGAQVYDSTAGEYGAGSTDWLGFIPDYRQDYVVNAYALDPRCHDETRLRNLVLSGDFEAARSMVDTGAVTCGNDGQLFGAMADLEIDGFSNRQYATEEVQNVWRYAGDLDRADAAVRHDLDIDTDDPLLLRLVGEISFLRHDYASAVEDFQRAADAEVGRYLLSGDEWSPAQHLEANLMLGLAQEKSQEAKAALSSYEVAGEIDDPDSIDEQSTATSAEARQGAVLSARGDTKGALPHLQRAAELAEAHDKKMASGAGLDLLDSSQRVSSGSDYNNLAAALLDLGTEPKEALKQARKALEYDPKSPIFSDTLAQALDANGKSDAAAAAYSKASGSDASIYQTQNNAGVLAARKGDRSESIAAFRRAVAANPGYALGWFNLGVELSKSSNPLDLVRGQVAMGRAVRLDSGYRGAGAQVRADRSLVVTGLDISRPIAPGWTFGRASHVPVSGLSLLLVIAAIWRLALALGVDKIGGTLGSALLSGRTHEGRSWHPWWTRLNRYTPLSWALGVTAVVAAWPFLGSTGSPVAGLATLSLMLSLAWLSVVVSRRSEKRGGLVAHRGWAPGMAFGGLSALLGYAFVPVPVNDSAGASGRTRWVPLAMLGCIAVAALAIADASGFPLVRLLGVAALAMVSTSLFPLKPFDGGFLRNRLAEVTVSLALLVASSALVLGWL